MRSLYTVAALLAVASAQSSYDSLFRTPPRNSNYSRLPSQYPTRPTAPRPTASSYNPTHSHTHLSPSYPYPAPVPKVPEKPLHEHDSSMLHENPWDQCKRDIASSQMSFADVSEDCNEAVDGLPALAAQLNGLAMTLEGEDTATTSDDVVANLVKNVEQTDNLESFKDNVTDILDSLQAQKLKLGMIQQCVELVPDFETIKQMIKDLEDKQGDVETLNTAQTYVIDGGDESTLTSDIPLLAGVIEDINTRIGVLVGESSDVATDNSNIGSDLDDLEALFAMQEIVDNFFSVNDSLVLPGALEMFNLEDNANEGTFSVCTADQVVEVFVHADFQPAIDPQSNGDNEEVSAVQLFDGNSVVAMATYAADKVDNQARNFNLYYKGVVPADDTKYTIRFISPAGQTVGATALSKNFMWGYRTFNDVYPIVTDLGSANTVDLMSC